MHTRKKFVAAVLGAAAIGASVIGLSVSSASPGGADTAAAIATTTPIKHVVVIYGENVSFDHYFGTYPFATNPPNEPQFHALPGTPTVNGLNTSLLEANPNVDNPQRLDPSQALTCDQNHGYSAERSAFDAGLMDKFVQDTTGGGCTETQYPDNGSYGPNGIVMDYFDGNTVTALSNYAQHFTLNDNSYNTQFGPSSPGAINVISGQTNGAVAHGGTSSNIAIGTLIGDAEPFYDQCSNSSTPLSSDGTPGGVTASLTGANIGDLLNRQNISWGWFQGGFEPSEITGGRAICGTDSANHLGQHLNVGNSYSADYSEHHEPFQYYASTSNPDHLSPASVDQVGASAPTGVNHQYDISWFNQAVANGTMPAVSYLKAPEYQDGHAGYSDPLDEQRFLVDEINTIEQSKDWGGTAIILAYDDSDGWYDHQLGPIIRQSADTADMLTGPGHCGSPNTTATGFQNDRCGVGPRQPLLVTSPWAKRNYVDSTFTEQASIPQFIENNWNLGRIGNESADAGAGTLDNAFDFNQSYGHAPAIMLNDTTGEIEKAIYPKGSDASTGSGPADAGAGGQGSTTGNVGASSAKGTGQNGSGDAGGAGGRGGNTSAGLGSVKLPKVSCRQSGKRHASVLSCTTRSGSNVATLFRARLYRGDKLISNVASLVWAHKVTFRLSLGRRSRGGRYTIRLSIDPAGRVGSLTRSVRGSLAAVHG